MDGKNVVCPALPKEQGPQIWARNILVGLAGIILFWKDPTYFAAPA